MKGMVQQGKVTKKIILKYLLNIFNPYESCYVKKFNFSIPVIISVNKTENYWIIKFLFDNFKINKN